MSVTSSSNLLDSGPDTLELVAFLTRRFASPALAGHPGRPPHSATTGSGGMRVRAKLGRKSWQTTARSGPRAATQGSNVLNAERT
ncbi:MAG: hypothetical protein ACRDRU_28305 [Pseudonocardiaceae bacterium]